MCRSSVLAVCILIVAAWSESVPAQSQTVRASGVSATANISNREFDGLKGPVRRVRLETARVVFKGGKLIEEPRALQGITTYDINGQKTDSVGYRADEVNDPPGRKQYRYDNGNIVEMVLRNDSGSIIGKESYQYDFDELGNWKKMVTSVAVYQNGRLSSEPVEVKYRSFTYYYGRAVTTIAAAAPGAVPGPAPTVSESTRRIAAPFESKTAGKPVNGSSLDDTAETVSVPAPKLPVKRMSEEMFKKAAIALPQPEYPENARLARVEGKVEVLVIVDEKGDVIAARATSGPEALNGAAEDAARRARFSAAVLSPDPAKVFGVLNYEFSLASSPGSPAASNRPFDTKAAAPASTSDFTALAQPLVPAANKPSATNINATASRSSFLQGLAHLASARYAEAVEAFEQAIQSDPEDALAYAKLGLAHSALHQSKEAVADFKTAIRLNRSIVDAESYYRLGDSYIALNDNGAAVEALTQSLYMVRASAIASEGSGPNRQAPTLVDLHYNLGVAYYNWGHFRQAAKELEEVVRLKPDLPKAHYALGLSYFGLGDRNSAQREERILREIKSPLADKLTTVLVTPGVHKNRVF